MFSIIYVSSAVKPFDALELRNLLDHCNSNNRKLHVTGMLLYKDGNFMQVLEGEEPSVRRLHEIIGRDRRHRGLITLLQGTTREREFPDWSMGFKDIGADLASPEGYSEFLNVPLTGAEFQANPSKAQKLLLMFKRSM
jgi:hypothetical protein